MSISRGLPFFPRLSRGRFSYAHRLSKRILRAGQWRAALRKQTEEFGDEGSMDRSFQFNHLLVGGTWLWIIASIIFAGILHISMVLGLPVFATKNAWSRIEKVTPVNEMLILPGGPAGQKILPQLAPDIRYAFCRYALAGKPIKLTLTVPDELWTIAIYNRSGDNFYTISGADLQRGDTTFWISATPKHQVQQNPAATKGAGNVINVFSDVKEGLIVIRAPIQGLAHEPAVNKLISQARCSS